MKRIESIVFDLGKVLIDYSHQRFMDFLDERSAHFENDYDFILKVDLFAYEHGFITTEQFIENVRLHTPPNVTAKEITEAWLDIFTPCSDMLDLARRIRDRHRLFVLSNIGELHWRHLKDSYSLDKIVHGLIASCEVGCMKPDPTIYRIVQDRFGLDPQTTVFIDDRIENVEGAESVGWKGIHHMDYQSTLSKLKNFGLR